MLESHSIEDIKKASKTAGVSNKELNEFFDFVTLIIGNYGVINYSDKTESLSTGAMSFSIFSKIYLTLFDIKFPKFELIDKEWKSLKKNFRFLYDSKMDSTGTIQSSCSRKDLQDIQEYLKKTGFSLNGSRIRKVDVRRNNFDIFIPQSENTTNVPKEHVIPPNKVIRVKTITDYYFGSLYYIKKHLKELIEIDGCHKDYIKYYLDYFKRGYELDHVRARRLAFKSKIIFMTGFIDKLPKNISKSYTFRTYVALKVNDWNTKIKKFRKLAPKIASTIPVYELQYLVSHEKVKDVMMVRLLRSSPGVIWFSEENVCKLMKEIYLFISFQ